LRSRWRTSAFGTYIADLAQGTKCRTRRVGNQKIRKPREKTPSPRKSDLKVVGRLDLTNQVGTAAETRRSTRITTFAGRGNKDEALVAGRWQRFLRVFKERARPPLRMPRLPAWTVDSVARAAAELIHTLSWFPQSLLADSVGLREQITLDSKGSGGRYTPWPSLCVRS